MTFSDQWRKLCCRIWLELQAQLYGASFSVLVFVLFCLFCWFFLQITTLSGNSQITETIFFGFVKKIDAKFVRRSTMSTKKSRFSFRKESLTRSDQSLDLRESMFLVMVRVLDVDLSVHRLCANMTASVFVLWHFSKIESLHGLASVKSFLKNKYNANHSTKRGVTDF